MSVHLHENSIVANYHVRREQMDGIDYLVAPVVLLTEGVHHGSGGPIYYSSAELAKFPEQWNGVPLPVFHPNGIANDPRTIEERSVGQLFNVQFDNDRLRGEIWININKCQRIAPEVLSYINSGRALEVSTGVFVEEIQVPGNWNGEDYRAIATNLRSEHLALLPGSTGACSYADGCGVRANQKCTGTRIDNCKKGERDETMIKPTINTEEVKVHLSAEFIQRLKIPKFLHRNELDYRETIRSLQSEADKLDSPLLWHFVKEVFDDHFIMLQEPRHENPMSADQESRLFRQDYNIDADNRVNLTGEPVEVIRETSFRPVTANESVPTKQKEHKCGGQCGENHSDESTHNEEEDQDMKASRQAMIGMLQKNERIEITEEQVTTLLALESCDEFAEQINTLLGNGKKEPIVVEEEVPTGNEEDDTEEQDAPVTMESLLKDAPEAVAAPFRRMEQHYNDSKKSIVAALRKVENCPFTEEQLMAKDLTELESLSALAGTVQKAPSVFAGNAGTQEKPVTENTAEPLAIPGHPVVENKKDETKDK